MKAIAWSEMSGWRSSLAPEGPPAGSVLATMALDRLVSVRDYADFARTFAGIGKSSAVSLSDGQRQRVHLTIAGADDIPVDYNSDLYRNLRQALLQFGDPFQPIQVAVRDLMLLVVSAGVRLQPDYAWESVEPKIRAALLDAFGFQRRELGQSAFLSEVLSAIQQVKGVAFVDMEIFDSVSASARDISGLLKTLERKPHVQVQLARPNPNPDPDNTDPDQRIFPAQLAYLTAEIPDTLILKELTA